MVPRRIVSASIVLMALLIASSLCWAQFTSAIEGTVTDQTGAVVANATVILTNEETGVTQTVQTQDNGNFRFTPLPAARFKLTASAQGFKTTIQEHVQVAVAETQTVNLHMTVGGG